MEIYVFIFLIIQILLYSTDGNLYESLNALIILFIIILVCKNIIMTTQINSNSTINV